jgi:hypothetical protein
VPEVMPDGGLLTGCYFRLSTHTLASYPELSRLRCSARVCCRLDSGEGYCAILSGIEPEPPEPALFTSQSTLPPVSCNPATDATSLRYRS